MNCGEAAPVRTRQWSSWAPRASGTTSCTWCETSMTASSEPWQTDTEPWCPERRRSKKALSLEARLQYIREKRQKGENVEWVSLVGVWLPPGSRRWKTEFLWTVSGRTLWSPSGAAVSDDGRARWDMDSSSGIAFKDKKHKQLQIRQKQVIKASLCNPHIV